MKCRLRKLKYTLRKRAALPDVHYQSYLNNLARVIIAVRNFRMEIINVFCQ